jgi:biofilm PGA synthesis protein PgaD
MPEIEIIDKPKLKSFVRKITELSFTSLMWGLWFYLFLPLLNFVLWIVGIRYFYIEVFDLAGYKGLIDLLMKAGWVILSVFLVLRSWGFYNYWRFGKKERRKSLPSETFEKTVEYFQVSPEQIQQIQSSKEVAWPLQHEIK